MFDQASAGTFAGSVSGSGKTVKQGEGTLVLTGASSADWQLMEGSLEASIDRFTGDLTLGEGTVMVFDMAGDSAYAGRLSGTGSLVFNGSGTTQLTGSVSEYGGRTTVNGGTLLIEGGRSFRNSVGYIGHQSGAAGAVKVTGAGSRWTNTGRLYVGTSSEGALTIADGGFVGVGSGSGIVEMGFYASAAGTLIIGAAAGSAAVAAGTLDAAEVRFGAGSGRIVFNHTDAAYAFAPKITGAGTLDQHAGTTILTADNSGFAGAARIHGGTLVVNGALGTETTVLNGGTLTGTGSIAARVSVAAGGTLAGVQGKTLSMQSLTLDSGASITATFSTPDSAAPLFAVTGDLVLDGTLNLVDGGGLSAGVYSLASYGGTLTDNGLVIGATPTGTKATDFLVQTAVAGKVNLISTAGAELRFWDGGNEALHRNGRIDGGAGVWRANGQTWTDASGFGTGRMQPEPAFAVFDGASGVVTLDGGAGAISATGLQFAVGGYRLTGDALTLAGANGESVIRVGNGSAEGAGFTATIASALTGSTKLVKADLGTLVLTGANSYTGGTEVRGGTLVGNAASIRGDLVNNGTVVFDEAGSATFAGSVSGTGTTVKRGAGVLTLTGTSSANWHVAEGELVAASERFAGDLVIDADATMTFNVAQDGIYAGRLSGAGRVVVKGTGRLTMTGMARDYAGVMTADAGTLVVDGQLAGHLNLGAGARLEGNGTLGSATLAGVVAPGHSIGKLTFTGDVTLAASSVYEVEVDAKGGSDLITTSGAARIEGSRLSVLAEAGDYQADTVYTILSAAGGVSGTFGEVTSNMAFLTPSLDYAATQVKLTLRRNTTAFPDVAITPNQRSVAAAVQALGASSPLYAAVVQLDVAGARQAFDQFSGEGHASLAGMLLDDTRLVRDAILARAPAETGLWSTVLGTWSNTDGDGNAASHRRSARGFQMGIDRPAGEHWRLGLSFGYLNRDLTTARGFSAEADGYSFGAYASGQYGRLSVTLGAVGSWHEAHTKRSVNVATLGETERGRYDADAFQAFAELGWQATSRGLALTPYVRVAHAMLDVDAFREDGGAAALAAEKNELEATYVELGARARSVSPINLGGTQLTLHGSASLRRAIGDITPSIAARLGDADAFRVAGVPIEKFAGSIDLGARAQLNDRLSLDLTYAAQLLGRTRDHGVRASASWRF